MVRILLSILTSILAANLRPSNDILNLKLLEGLSAPEVYDIIGRPEIAKMILKKYFGESVHVPNIHDTRFIPSTPAVAIAAVAGVLAEALSKATHGL
jgi:hypothetical protein